jgi:hypothetical protein
MTTMMMTMTKPTKPTGVGATRRAHGRGVAPAVGGRRRRASVSTSTRARANGDENASSWVEEVRADDDDAGSGSGSGSASASASTSASAFSAVGEDDDGDRAFAFEPKSKSKRKRDRSKTRRAKVDVDSPAVDALLGKREKTLSEETEEAYVKFLFLYVNVIFVLGVTLGVSAFGKLPESVDAFVADKLYPFFTPFVGGFLAFSSVYGLIKTRDDPNA